MNALGWVLQLVLAALFAAAGISKATQPVDKLGTSLPWVNDVPKGLVRLIGVAELAGAIGLVGPWATDTATWLTPTAGIGLSTIMVLAMFFHIRRNEPNALVFTGLILASTLAVVLIRFDV